MNILSKTLFSSVLVFSALSAKQAYNFSAQALFPDGKIQQFSLNDHKGKKIILYFYPKNGTPGCTKQAKIFRDNFKDLQDQGVVVVGVSYDSLSSHKKFQKKHQLPFILVCDEDKKISKKYDSSGWLMPSRKTILIDEKGSIVKRFDSVDIKNQIQDIKKAFKLK